jgi:SAM-dependent methyltransferase
MTKLVNLINAKIGRRLGFEISRVRPAKPLHMSRFEYQQRFLNFQIREGSRVLDIGSGGDPFPYATVLAERYLEPSRHRVAEFRANGKPVVVCDIQDLPFASGSFDYIYCAHVLEHVDDPIRAARELMRVGKRGYIETPHFMTDALFGWAKGMHKWFVQSIDNRLVFFEYDERRADGIRSSAWRDIIFSSKHSPLQDVFADNKDLFTMMFPWHDKFAVDVYYVNGTVRRSTDGM